MNESQKDEYVRVAIDAAVKIVLLGAMISLSFQIIRPFVMPVIWAVVIAVSMGPLVGKLVGLLGGRKKLGITLFTLCAIGLLVVPTYLLLSSSFEHVQGFAGALKENKVELPPAPEKFEKIPVVGEKVTAVWNEASTDLKKAIKDTAPLGHKLAASMSSALGGLLGSVAQFVISFIIAAFFMYSPEKGFAASTKLMSSVAGKRGEEFTRLATATIRGVMNGVVGVAIVQAILGTLGMVVMGIPAAGIWGLLVLIFAIAQLPPIIILGPVAIYAFGAHDTVPAVIFAVWSFLVSACDGVIKPILMARGLDTPMLVILLGAIGGMMLSGIIGLFVGAVVLSITYTIFMAWVNDRTQGSAEVEEAPEAPETV